MIKFPADESRNFLGHGMDPTALQKLMDQMSACLKCTSHRSKESRFINLESNIAQLISQLIFTGTGETIKEPKWFEQLLAEKDTDKEEKADEIGPSDKEAETDANTKHGGGNERDQEESEHFHRVECGSACSQ